MIDAHVPSAAVVVQTFIVMLPAHDEPFVQVVLPPPLLPLPLPLLLPLLLLPLPPPLPLLLPLPPLPLLLADASPLSSPPFPSSGADAPGASGDRGERTHPQEEPEPHAPSYVQPGGISPLRGRRGKPMWTQSHGEPIASDRLASRDGYPRSSPMSVFSKPPNDGSGAAGPPKADPSAVKPPLPKRCSAAASVAARHRLAHDRGRRSSALAVASLGSDDPDRPAGAADRRRAPPRRRRPRRCRHSAWRARLPRPSGRRPRR